MKIESHSEQELRQACAELSRRLRAGECGVTEEILASRPELAVAPDAAIDLIYTEVIMREELGIPPNPEELFQRFPQWRDRIERLLDVHAALWSPAILPAAAWKDTSRVFQPTIVAGDTAIPIEPAVASAISRYELLEPLGRGGMGVVFRARQRGLDRVVALKLIRNGSLASAEELERFRKEAEAAAHLQHPNIVQIFDIGEHEGSSYLSMEYVDGGNLEQWLGDKILPADSAARLVYKLAEATEYAHQHGIVHRDLKPANVLMSLHHNAQSAPGKATVSGTATRSADSGPNEANPKITDFGLAKRLDGGPGLTTTGEILGTPTYMAPEQAAGRAQDVGPAADIYSLGAILYRLLTGRPPFQGDTVVEVLEQLSHHEPIPPRRLQPSLPRDLENICLKCLQKEPRKRYASSQAVADDLNRFLTGDAVEARPVQPWERVVIWAKRRPAVAGLMTMIFAVIAIGFPTVTALWLRAETAWGKTEEARQAEEAERERVEQLLYAHDVMLARHEYLHSNPERALQLLDDCREDLRRWEWRFLKQLCQQERHHLTGHTLPISCVVFSPDGSRFASCSSNWGFDEPGEIIVWDTTSGKKLFTLHGHPSSIVSIAFSPDGRQLASAGVVWFPEQASTLNHPPADVKLWDMATGNEIFSIPNAGTTHSVAYSPDGQLLALGGAQGVIKLCDVSTGKEIRRLVGHTHSVYHLAFSPQGTRLATGSHDGTVRLWDVSDAKELDRATCNGDVRSIAYNPNGRQLAAATYAGTVYIWRISGNPVQLIAENRWHAGKNPRLVFSPDGQQLALSSTEMPIAIIATRTGRIMRRLYAHGLARTKVLAFSPDGRTLATGGADRVLKLWDLTASPTPQNWLVKKADSFSHISSIAVSPSGQQLAMANVLNRSSPGLGMTEKALTIWDVNLNTGRDFTEHTDWLTSVAYSPDGSRIATGSQDKTAKLWDAQTGRVLFSCGGHAAAVTDVVFHSHKGLFLSCSEDSAICVWDAATGDQVHRITAHAGGVMHIACSPSGRLIASVGADHKIKIWDVHQWRELVAVDCDFRIAYDLAFSPDNQLLACCTDDRQILVWDVQQLVGRSPIKRPLHQLRGHTDSVVSLAFSPDSQRIASISADQTLKLWTTDAGYEVLTLDESIRRQGSRISFSPDGNRIYISSGRFLSVWECPAID